GLWDAIRPRLVLGENVSQAAQFAPWGSTQGGIVAQSLALSPQVASNASFALIPARWHRPLRQRMGLKKGAGDTARAFHDWLWQPSAREVLARYGFEVGKSVGGEEGKGEGGRGNGGNGGARRSGGWTGAR